jgi:hypothetical protein
VTGGFSKVATITQADFVAKWNGSTWSAFGSTGSGSGALANWVRALAVSGTDVYVGGQFGVAGNHEANSIAAWNGSAWFALGSTGSGLGPITSGSGVLVLAA